jgi:hypothetical protein
MVMSTAYFLERQHDSAYLFMPDEPDVETLGKQAIGRSDIEDLRNLVLDALAPSAWQSSQQTFGYRWRGEDTLDWGNLENWIQIKLARDLVESARVPTRLMEYDALRQFIVERSRLRQLGEFYSFRDALAIRGFLRAHPQLTEVLLEAHAHLQECFGPDPQVALEVVSDPEAEGPDELFAYILTSLPADEALARLDRLDEEWFLDQLDRVGTFFNFNLEFV